MVAFWVLLGDVSDFLCFPPAVDNLLRELPAEVPEDDPEDLHEVPGVPHPAERGPGSQGRAAEPAPLGQSTVLTLELCQCSLGKDTWGIPAVRMCVQQLRAELGVLLWEP